MWAQRPPHRRKCRGDPRHLRSKILSLFFSCVGTKVPPAGRGGIVMLDQLNFVWVISFLVILFLMTKSIFAQKYSLQMTPHLSLCCCSNCVTCICLICGGSKCCFVCLNRTLSVTARKSVSYFILLN